MATAPTSAPVARNIIDDFSRVSMQLIQEAAEYIAGGVNIPETEANIRKLRILSQALNAALMGTAMPQNQIVPTVVPMAAPAPPPLPPQQR